MGLFTPYSFLQQKVAAVELDPDAAAFLTAAGITDPTIVSAINNLVIDLKSNSLWNKFNALYPFVGGTATTHKYNLINPADTNAAYRLTFSGTITHNSDGITGDGTTGYGNTYLSPSNAGGGQDDIHISLYSNYNFTAGRAGTDIGATNASTSQVGINMRNPSNLFFTALNNFNFAGTANTNGGFFLTSRTSSASYERYKNTTATTHTITSVSPTTQPIYVSAWNNNGTAANFQNRTINWASIGFGLNSTEESNLYTIVQNFQTSLGREI